MVLRNLWDDHIELWHCADCFGRLVRACYLPEWLPEWAEPRHAEVCIPLRKGGHLWGRGSEGVVSQRDMVATTARMMAQSDSAFRRKNWEIMQLFLNWNIVKVTRKSSFTLIPGEMTSHVSTHLSQRIHKKIMLHHSISKDKKRYFFDGISTYNFILDTS